jgi:hypothetical protein
MVQTAKGKFPHIEWIDLKGNGVLIECAIVKRDAQDNIYFINLREVDEIDKRRLFKIITSRGSERYELWDLLSQKTLGNGINALEYFHQLTKVITSRGVVIKTGVGSQGVGMPAPVGQRLTQTPKAEPATVTVQESVNPVVSENTEEAAPSQLTSQQKAALTRAKNKAKNA